MKIHEIKTVEPFFTQSKYGMKGFELRNNDRNYAVGDYLLLQQFIEGELTGDTSWSIITYFLQGYVGLLDDYCILGTRLCADPEEVTE